MAWLTLTWDDNRFVLADETLEGDTVQLQKEWLQKIWLPDIYIMGLNEIRKSRFLESHICK